MISLEQTNYSKIHCPEYWSISGILDRASLSHGGSQFVVFARAKTSLTRMDTASLAAAGHASNMSMVFEDDYFRSPNP